MPPSPNKLQDAILAILAAARDAGRPKLTKTALVKFVYLIDYYTAVESKRIFTDTPWRFLYFGPYDASVATAIDDLGGQAAIDVQQGGGSTKDYTLHWLPQHKQVKTLEEIGVHRQVRIEVEQKLRQFGSDLAGLLNFVYYQTEPMQIAEPQQLLDFSVCEKVPYQSVRPLAMKPIPADKLTAYRAALAELRNQPKPPALAWGGQYDEAYFGALLELEGEPLDTSERMTLHL